MTNVGKTPAERRAARSRVFAAAVHARHAHGRPFAVTPRIPVAIVPTAVTPHREIEAGLVRPDRSATPSRDGTFTPASEAIDVSIKT